MSNMAPKFFDLREAILNWAWKKYEEHGETWKQRRLRKKEEKDKEGMYVAAIIDWSKLKIVDRTEWPTLRGVPSSGKAPLKLQLQAAGKGQPSSEVAESTDLVGSAEQESESGTSNLHLLFRTKFTNNTEEPQEYTMKTEKTTSSEMQTQLEHSWTKGIDMGLSLKTPGEICEFSAGYSREFTLTNTDGETFAEQLTWAVESQIKVKEGYIADASLNVHEKKYDGAFIVRSELRGRIRVEFKNTRKNNAFIKACSGDIVDVFRRLEKNRIMPHFAEIVDKSDESPAKVILKTKGKCQFSFAINQEVFVDQKKIQDN